jgi:hypothetical protein
MNYHQTFPMQMTSLREAYLLATSARKKLSIEASRASQDLRIILGHANLLDTLAVALDRCLSE